MLSGLLLLPNRREEEEATIKKFFFKTPIFSFLSLRSLDFNYFFQPKRE